MKPAPFDYHRPETLDEALGLLAELGPDARPLAGGQSLIPFMNFRLARPGALVDLNHIDDLAGISEDEGGLTLGAMTRQWDVEHSAAVERAAPMLPTALHWVGHTATRTRGTIGGSIAHADPAAELPTAAVALGAEMTVANATGESRVIPAEQFFLDHYTTALGVGDLLVDIRFPVTGNDRSWSFKEFSFRSGDFAIASVAATLDRDDNGVGSATVTLGGVGATPVRAREAENALLQTRPSDEVWRSAARAAAAEIDPIDDEVPAGYRRQIVATLVEDALSDAWRSAGEDDG